MVERQKAKLEKNFIQHSENGFERAFEEVFEGSFKGPFEASFEAYFESLDLKKYDYLDFEKKAIKNCAKLGYKLLEEKKRISGESFFLHNIKSAKVLLEVRAAAEVIAAMFLHKSLYSVSKKELHEGLIEALGEKSGKFVKEIVHLVEEAAQIRKIKQKNEKLAANALRKILLQTVKDPRVLFIKLADKVDNLKDVNILPDKKEVERICQEVLDIYAPLASRLGVEKIKSQLEDLAFKVLKAKEYAIIEEFVEQSREEREEIIAKLVKELSLNLKVPLVKIKGRIKNFYSVYKKVNSRIKDEKKRLGNGAFDAGVGGVGAGVVDEFFDFKSKLSKLYDLLAIRIIVEKKEDCYIVLGYLHEKYEPIMGRLKDYIAAPKPNGYQSIHTGILLNSKRVEVQIRSLEMNEFSEEGMAAHWRYKKIKGDLLFEKRIGWLKGVLDVQKDASAKEFLENVKVDLFSDEIYCYTPKGDVKYFPINSGVLDFAYTVHEEVGNRAIGARINGKFVSLKAKISQGDVIEIVTSKNQRPRRGWLKLVNSAKAKQKIRKGVKKYQDLPALHYRKYVKVIQDKHDNLTVAKDFENAYCVLAKCCLAIPGEEIVGVITKKRLVSVHNVECKQAVKMQDRWVEVNWRETFNRTIKMQVVANERSGLLADLLNTIARAKFEVREAKAKMVGTGRSECSFVIVPRKLSALESLLKVLFKVKGVKTIYFE